MKKIIYLIRSKGLIYIGKKVIFKTREKIANIWEATKFSTSRNKIKDIKFVKSNGKNFTADKKEILEFYNTNNHIKNKIIKEANRIISNEFDFLGIKIQMQDEIQWNKDFKSGYVWKNKYYKFINLNSKGPMDIKIPWELSRLHFLIILGKAYVITGNEKYYIKFEDTILHWINSNPYKKSVNWTCAMDVAIRSINIIVAKELFQDKIGDQFELKLNNLIYSHGEFILENLENHEPRSNHYISDLIGLFWIGIYFKGNEFGDNLIEFAIKELEGEVETQINNDGTNYEAATSYHKLVLELLLFTIIYGEKNKVFFSLICLNKIKKMCEFMYNILKPNNIIPLIGDNDDGRLIILGSYYEWDRRDPRYLLSISSIFFNEDRYMFNDEDSVESIAIVFGNRTINNVKNKKYLSKKYEDGGFYILRNNRIYCLVRCGELSMRGHGGHSHNEQLSIELNIDGIDIFIDPGTYTYTSDYAKRNKFRSTLMHNTVQIGEYEQNDINFWNIFELKEQTFAQCLKFDYSSFIGTHKGYLNKYKCNHIRCIDVYEEKIIIKDIFKNKDLDKIINFILPSNLKIVKNNSDIIINDKYLVRFEEEPLIKEIEYSPSYGVLIVGKQINVVTNNSAHITTIEIL